MVSFRTDSKIDHRAVIAWERMQRERLTGNALHRVNAFELVRKRAAAAGIKTSISV
jgi:hypothetical protein